MVKKSQRSGEDRLSDKLRSARRREPLPEHLSMPAPILDLALPILVGRARRRRRPFSLRVSPPPNLGECAGGAPFAANLVECKVRAPCLCRPGLRWKRLRPLLPSHFPWSSVGITLRLLAWCDLCAPSTLVSGPAPVPISRLPRGLVCLRPFLPAHFAPKLYCLFCSGPHAHFARSLGSGRARPLEIKQKGLVCVCVCDRRMCVCVLACLHMVACCSSLALSHSSML